MRSHRSSRRWPGTATPPAISSARAKRPIGRWTSRRAARSGSLANSSRSSGVSTGPGHSALTRTPCARELDAELARERQHAALRRGVGDLRGRGAHHRDERGGVDHRAAGRVVGEQMRDAVLAAEEHALEVDVLDALPGLERGVEHRRVVGRRDPGVVEEHVDPAELARARAYMSRPACSSVTSTSSARSPGAGEQVDADDRRALALRRARRSPRRSAAAPVITQTLPSSLMRS